jgi:single-strand DNA-binding protein
MDLNRVMIIGRLTQDPELRTTPGGQPVVNFSVATNRRWQDQQGNRQEQVEYHNVVAWRKLAEIASQYLRKGRQVYVDGYLQTRTWQGKDGQQRQRTEIIAENLILLGSREEVSSANTVPAKAEAASSPARPSTTSTPAEKVATSAASPQSGKEQQEEEIRIEDIPF